jgi:hypothetical protein
MKARLTALTIRAVLLLPLSLCAQITFERTYGGPGDDYGYSVQQNADSGYIVAGQASAADYYLIRTDAAGHTLWSRTWDYWVADVLYGVLQTADGGFVTVGQHWGNGQLFTNFVRTDAQGNKADETGWVGFCAYSLRQNVDGGYAIAGSGSNGYDVGLIRTDGGGHALWGKSFGFGCGYSALQTADSGFVVTGFLSRNGDDIYLVKTNSSGDTMWTRLYGGDSSETGRSVQQTADGGYIIAGDTKSFGNGGRDVYLVKTDTVGDTMWTRTFGGTDDDEGYSVKQVVDGGYVIAGFTESFGAGRRDMYVIKTNATGDTLWTRTFGGGNDDEGQSVQQTTDGGYVICGYTKSFGAGGADVWLIKTDSLGNVGVAEPKTGPIRAKALSLSCQPNPCRSSTVFHLTAGQLDHSIPVLRIYDAQGRLVRLLSSILHSLSSLVWDGTDDLNSTLPSGAYFARVDVGGKHATTRVILQH